MQKHAFFAAVVLIFAIGSDARAAGVIEINQACVPVGCFAGDDPGFPVEISDSGSYRLTGNLVVPDSSSGISLAGGRPTVDLNGFELRGPVACTATLTADSPPLLDSVACTGSGGTGITAATDGFRIMNGTVAGFGTGIQTDYEGVIEDMTIRENSSDGIATIGATLRIHNTTISTNGDDGVDGQTPRTRLLVTESMIRSNADTGIYLANGTVRNSVFTLNGDDAIRSRATGGGGLVSDCHFSYNIEGIDAFGGLGVGDSVFLGNTSDFGATSLGGNLCDGVSC